jgi:hypothetical protein
MSDTTLAEGSLHAEFSRGHQIGDKKYGVRDSLANVVKELERQKASKFDFVVDPRQLDVTVREDDGVILLGANCAQAGEFFPDGPVPIGYDAIGQLGHRVVPTKKGGSADMGIPTRYLRSLIAQHPDIAASLLTQSLHATSKRRLIRCLDGRVRAVLSSRYRILDNLDFAFAALDAARKHDGEVIECHLTDRAFKLKMTTQTVWDQLHTTRESGPSSSWYAGALGNQTHLNRVAARRWDDLPGGPNQVNPLCIARNSETGHGGAEVIEGFLEGICFNLAVVMTVASHRHVGSDMSSGLLTDETLGAMTQALRLEIRDYVTSAFDKDRFTALVEKLNQASATEIKAPSVAIDNVIKLTELPESYRDDLLTYFIRDYEPTVGGLASAVTRYAQDVTSPDAADRLEEAGGQLWTDKKLGRKLVLACEADE